MHLGWSLLHSHVYRLYTYITLLFLFIVVQLDVAAITDINIQKIIENNSCIATPALIGVSNLYFILVTKFRKEQKENTS